MTLAPGQPARPIRNLPRQCRKSGLGGENLRRMAG